MLRTRAIPVLLLRDAGLVKGTTFKNHKYVGDPVNAVRIFNEKEVDEIVFLDISATPAGRGPNYELIADIASEAFMPFGYGGGIGEIGQIERLFNLGVEKVVINTAAFARPQLVREASRAAGAQSIVVSIDVREKMLGGYEVCVANGTRRTGRDPVDYAREMQDLGAGELIVCSINREGTGKGYDTRLLRRVSEAVDIPVVALGGASGVADFADAVKNAGVSAVAAGDMFVFHGRHKAVLITYPAYAELEAMLGDA